jgi:hypothetical protein
VQQKFHMQLNGKELASSALTNVDLMAQRNLSEKMPAIVIRQALRVVAKEQLRKETTNGNDVGNLVLNVWNTLTEQPDTRSWITLPASVHGITEVVPSGEQTLNAAGKSYSFNVPDQGTTLVWVSQQGANATMWHKQLGKL